MTTFLLTFGILVVLMLGMAVGVIMGRKPIAGSCGGMQALGLKGDCDICGGDLEKCEEANQEKTETKASDLAYEVK